MDLGNVLKSGTWVNTLYYFPLVRNVCVRVCVCVVAGGLDIVLEVLERMTAEKGWRDDATISQ